MKPNSSAPTASLFPANRGWLIAFGLLSLGVGLFAIARPGLASLAIEQVIGILLVVSGVFTIGNVLFGNRDGHPVYSVLLAAIRLIAGVTLLVWAVPGVLALSVVVGAFFLVEGLVFIAAGVRARSHRVLMVLNGIVALILGAMVFAQFPSNAIWIIGLLYGINAIFYGLSLLTVAFAPKAA